MPPDALSTTFAALADPTRRAILARLVAGQASVTDLARPFAMTLPAVSKHLRVLERAGLIARSRAAQSRPCRLEAAPLRDATGWLETYRGFWEDGLDRMDHYLRALQAGATVAPAATSAGAPAAGSRAAAAATPPAPPAGSRAAAAATPPAPKPGRHAPRSAAPRAPTSRRRAARSEATPRVPAAATGAGTPAAGSRAAAAATPRAPKRRRHAARSVAAAPAAGTPRPSKRRRHARRG